MRHVVVMQKIPLHRLDVLIGVSMLPANLVAQPRGAVNQHFNPCEPLRGSIHGRVAALRRSQLRMISSLPGNCECSRFPASTSLSTITVTAPSAATARVI